MKSRIKFLIAGLAATTMFATTTPVFADYLPGEDTQAERSDGLQSVVNYLSIEQFVPSRLEFRQLSADPVRDLVTVASQARYSEPMRARAVQTLALYVDDERAVAAIDELMTNVIPGQHMFGPTLVAYAAVHGEAVTEAIAPYAEHPRDDVRMASVVALGRYCGQAGADTLKNLVKSEEDEAVLARIKQYVM